MTIGRRGFVASLTAGALSAQHKGPVELANERVALGFDPASGAIQSIQNRATGRRIDLPEQASSLRLWAGTQAKPDEIQIAISRAQPQPVRIERGVPARFKNCDSNGGTSAKKASLSSRRFA